MATVPNVIGMTQAAATAAIKGAQLFVSVTQQTSNTVLTGKVISQDPAGGSSMAIHSFVKLVISSGPPMATVPNVVGMTQAAATAAIKGAQLFVSVTQQTSNTVLTGKVISQDPAGGSSVAIHSFVKLVISLGPPMATVPNVVGMTEAAATAAIIGAQFTVGTVTPQISPTVPSGHIVSQAPAAGTSVAQGTLVNLVVSSATGLPPDPSTVAPPIDTTIATSIGSATAFLYTGSTPIQTGVIPGTIEFRRAGVLRGKVLDRGGLPLPGVQISVLKHIEFGQTLSRPDGMFDMAVNGGGPLTVDYQKAGFLPAQRQVNVPWQEYTLLPNVILIPVDTQVTTIDLTAITPIQMAQGSEVTDTNGTRQAALLFPQGAQAQIVMPDGNSQPISTLSVRATEYTVGDSGPKAMPAELPPTSAYTYAVEFSADEAVAAGANDVQFSQPVIFYVENFLGFPVGGIVPVGYYDRDRGVWVPSLNGQIIKILSDASGLVGLDTDGDGVADSAGALAALGITDAEREQLVTLYAPGQTLWRVPITHFTPLDCNWPYGLPDDAEAPNNPDPDDPYDPDKPKPNDPCRKSGSIIECQNQVLGEVAAITGTPFSLHYRSDRVRGRLEYYTLEIPLSGASLPASLKRIDLVIDVAGQRFSLSFPPTPNQTYTFTWNGKDAYNHTLQGAQPIRGQTGYVYEAVYMQPAQAAQSFAAFSGTPMTGSSALKEITLWQNWQGLIGDWDARAQGLGSWSLNVHHAYDLIAKILYVGGGGGRSAQGSLNKIITVAGIDPSGYNGDGIPATAAKLHQPFGVAVGADGSLYIADTTNRRIRRIGPDGIIITVAGTGVYGYSGDGGPATAAKLENPHGIAVGADGSLYIADDGNARIRRVGPEEFITTVAGTGVAGYSGDGSPATAAKLNQPGGIAVGADGSLYIADTNNHRIRRVGPDGIISTVAGTGVLGFSGDGGPATAAKLWMPRGIAVGADGSLYIADAYNGSIRRVGPDGIISTVAGTGVLGFSGDGGPATAAKLDNPFGIAVGADGSLYIADGGNARIRRVGPDGIISTLAGTGVLGFSGDGGPATAAKLRPGGIAVGADGSLYIADTNNHRIRQVTSMLPGLSVTDILIPAEDGSELYVFTGEGRHLKTLNTLTGALRYQFTYDSAGRLTNVTDGDGNITTIQRNVAGEATAIVAPGGQQTTLGLNADGYLGSITNPAGDSVQLTYYAGTADGLLATLTDPLGNVHLFTHDALGRLTKDEDPAGGMTTLTRTDTPKSYKVSLTTALGQTTTYLVENLPTGELHRTNTFCTGLTAMTQIGTNGTLTTTLPDGMTTTLVKGPDPRFGMLAPLAQPLDITTPGGKHFNITTSRSVTLTDPSDFLSLTSQTDTVAVNGMNFTSTFNAAAKTITNKTPLQRQTITILDNKGRVVETTIADLEPIQFTYDANGRVSTITQGTRSAEFHYNPQGYLSSVTDPLNRTTAFAYDAAGRVTTCTLPDGRQVAYTYDANGNVSSITPPGRPSHGFNFTPIDLLKDYTPPDVGLPTEATLYSHNVDGQLDLITRPDGVTIDFEYSPCRLIKITIPNRTISYSYALANDPAPGTLAQISANGITLAYAYDGNLLTDTTWSGPVSGTVHRSYDSNFRLASESVNGGNAIEYYYDNDGFRTVAGPITLGRDAQNGRVTDTTVGNITDSYGYNNFGEVSEYEATSSGTTLLAVQDTRDNVGLIAQRTETISGITHTYGYTYDLSGRLTGVTKDAIPISDYTYDDNGNRLSAGGISGSYDEQDRLLQYGTTVYMPTANGEVKSKTDTATNQTTTYIYDVLGNLIATTLPDGTQIDYLIDGRNRRIGKKVNGALVQGFLYRDYLNPVAELDGSNAVVSRFVYGTKVKVPDVVIKGGVTYRIITDQCGSPRLVVDTATGAILQRMDYDEFGNVILDTNPGFQPFGFAGGLYDVHTKLTRFGFRDYDAETGRWTARDPIGFAGGSPNLFGYVLNDPVNYIDPLGLWGVGQVGGGVAEAGFGPGAAANGSGGLAFFSGGSRSPHVGIFGSLGAFVGGGAVGSHFPTDADPRSDIAIGATIGIGGGWFFTNVDCVEQLEDISEMFNLHLPFLSFQLGVSDKNDLWTFSMSAGKSLGASFSIYPTKTWTAGFP